MKTFVIGDIHGNLKALRQCLKRSFFNPKEDRLIALGDVCDGWPDVDGCIEELLRIPHLEYLVGNHDLWALNWALTGAKPQEWVTQGGKNTISSYGKNGMPAEHVAFLNRAKWAHVFKNKLFVHAGIDPAQPLELQDKDILVWDRQLIKLAQLFSITKPDYRFSTFDEIYIGHTTTETFRIHEPIRFCNVWAMDTGAGWQGRLSMMDIDSKEVFQSDQSGELYPNVQGRS